MWAGWIWASLFTVLPSAGQVFSSFRENVARGHFGKTIICHLYIYEQL